MPHRRANYILSKTRSIRNLTVKGLEPELDQLMEAHQSDLVKLHAAKVAIRRRISVALDGELLQRAAGGAAHGQLASAAAAMDDARTDIRRVDVANLAPRVRLPRDPCSARVLQALAN